MNDISFYSITKEQAKNGAECRWRKYQMKLHAVIGAIMLLIITPLLIIPFANLSPHVDTDVIISIAVFIFIIADCPFVAFIIYNYVCYKRIISAVDKCPVYRVTLDKPHGSYYYRGGVVYYTVEFQTDEGNVKLDTAAIFATYGWFVPFEMQEYNNKDVYVLYDKDRESIYVIDLVDKIH